MAQTTNWKRQTWNNGYWTLECCGFLTGRTRATKAESSRPLPSSQRRGASQAGLSHEISHHWGVAVPITVSTWKVPPATDRSRLKGSLAGTASVKHISPATVASYHIIRIACLYCYFSSSRTGIKQRSDKNGIIVFTTKKTLLYIKAAGLADYPVGMSEE